MIREEARIYSTIVQFPSDLRGRLKKWEIYKIGQGDE